MPIRAQLTKCICLPKNKNMIHLSHHHQGLGISLKEYGLTQ